MPSTSSMLKRIRHDYPQFIFQNAHVAHWSPRDNTVYFRPLRTPRDKVTFLHELGHAIRGHHDYNQDIELLRCEREAWETARTIAHDYDITISDDIVTAALDSYRRWLHDRSRCPQCESSGTQAHDSLAYRCMLCDLTWHANDARQCGLRRYTL